MGGGIHPPSSVLTEWILIANPAHPAQTRGWKAAVICIILYTATAAVVVARLWARLRSQHAAGIDDVLITISMLPLLALALAVGLGSRMYGFDRHAYDLTTTQAVNSRKITMVIEAAYVVSTSLTKMSILLFYRRMATGSISRLFRYTVILSIISVAGYMIGAIVALFLSCRPLNAFWNQANSTWALTHTAGVNYSCIDEPANLLAASSISIAQDFLACGLPTMLFWKLRLPRAQKFALAGIFGVGFFLCITGVLRIYYIHNLYFETYDSTWAAQDVFVWTVVEAHLAIICASAPALKFFFRQFLATTFSASRTRSWPRGSYFRKSSAGHGGSAYGTTSTAHLDGMKCVELGGINVTKAIDIETRSVGRGNSGKTWYSNIDSDYLRMPRHPLPPPTRTPSRAHLQANTTWLFIDPNAPHAR